MKTAQKKVAKVQKNAVAAAIAKAAISAAVSADNAWQTCLAGIKAACNGKTLDECEAAANAARKVIKEDTMLSDKVRQGALVYVSDALRLVQVERVTAEPKKKAIVAKAIKENAGALKGARNVAVEAAREILKAAGIIEGRKRPPTTPPPATTTPEPTPTPPPATTPPATTPDTSLATDRASEYARWIEARELALSLRAELATVRLSPVAASTLAALVAVLEYKKAATPTRKRA